jgi:hypothetical protein
MTTQNPAPPELSDQQVAELSPAAREQYFHDRAAAGVEDGGMFGWVRRMQANMEAEGQADKASQNTVRDLSSGSDVQFVEGLNPSDADYQGHEHAQMSQYVAQNLEPAQVTEISEAYHKLHTAFKDFATELKEAVGKSEHEWEGEAASDARNYFTSLQTWSDGNSTNAKLASETIYQQSEAATSAKNRMPEEIPFNWESEMDSWGDNPLDLIGNINKSMETYRASNEAHAEAAGVMTQYDTDLYTAASKQPVFAEPPKFGEGSGNYEVNQPKPGENSTGASGFVGGPAGAGGGSIPSASIPPGGGGGSSIPPVGGGGGYTPTPMPAPLTRGPSTGTGSVRPVGNTRPSGYQQPNFNPSRAGSGGGSTGLNGMGAMPMGGMAGGMGGGGSGSDYNSKIGRGGGGFGPGGGGAAGSGSASGPASGAAKPGGLGAAEAAAGRGGAAGVRGMGGMGAGMGGGRGGLGGEDEDHQRPTYLVEGDPDAVFGTDQRTAPPVIGE